MKNKILSIALICSLFITVSCKKEDITFNYIVIDGQRAALSEQLLQNTTYVNHVYTDTTITLAPGVEETDIHFKSIYGHTIRMFILKADMSNTANQLYPLTPYGAESYAMQTIPEQVRFVDDQFKVLFATNSDFYNMSTGEPRSVVYLKGKAVKAAMQAGRGFFGTDKSGKMILGTEADLANMQSSFYNVLGGYHLLVNNGRAVSQTDATIEPRTAVGITKDQQLYIIVVDGRRYDYSYGIDFKNLSEIFVGLGVDKALNLDGGGSSTFLINNPIGNVFQVRNWSSDLSPRAVANGWSIVTPQ